MSLRIKVKGLNITLAMLRKEKKVTVGAMKKGMILTALNIEAISKRLAPVDIGNLRASIQTYIKGRRLPGKPRFKKKSPKTGRIIDEGTFNLLYSFLSAGYAKDVNSFSKKKQFAVAVGVGAYYGLWVHEKTNVRHTVGESKYLQKAVNQEEKNIEKNVMKYMKGVK